jgi:hypothetical protein
MADDLLALSRRLQDAVQHQDAETLEELVAPEFRLITSRAGNPVERDDWIRTAVGPFRVSSYALQAVSVCELGDTAVVVHRNSQDARLGDRQAAREWLTTDVWTRHRGPWQILARHAEAVSD